jgi:trehalose 6-phosphate phosphatase
MMENLRHLVRELQVTPPRVKNILGQECREILQNFAKPSTLLAFDFDGTLAPIVDNRELAQPRPSTVRLVNALAELTPCAIISGRSCRDLAHRTHELNIRWRIGNHGMEWEDEDQRDGEEFAALVTAWKDELRGILGGFAGTEIEDKNCSLAIHYRNCPAERRGLRKILELRAELLKFPNCRLIDGKEVFNLVPQQAPHKGTALTRLRERLGSPPALYLGDDVTDEDVFSLQGRGKVPASLLTIRIGEDLSSAADFFLSSQAEIDGFLELYLGEIQGLTRRA